MHHEIVLQLCFKFGENQESFYQNPPMFVKTTNQVVLKLFNLTEICQTKAHEEFNYNRLKTVRERRREDVNRCVILQGKCPLKL